MTITKVILIPAFIALLLGLAASYLATSFQAQESFKVHKAKVEENAKNRREKVCIEIEKSLPENPALAIELIQNEIDELGKRKAIRWQG
ncbi:hypothetical protein [Vreelandella boliviensis]|uniref:hypothetical protein n=1 Tax=Vreelandella boliviensis TaxID=223527 RepID=UPI001B8C15C0|nr:hypothetical protein [Halomonas boliviensis]MBS3667630.1 hypothetical protein [Halomonas boliviensis]